MDSYNQFVSDAVANYQKLPQETSELYKRYYINIPFDVSEFGKNKENGNSTLKSIVDDISSKLGIGFDLAIGSSDAIIGDSKFLKLERTEQLKDYLDKSMHLNNEDKYVSYINSDSARSVVIDLPEGNSANLNVLMLNSNVPLNIRVFIKLGRNSKLKLFEYYGSSNDSNTTLGTIHEIYVGENSEVDVDTIHNESPKTLVLSFCKNRMESNGNLTYNALYSGGAHTRVRNVIDANGEHGKVSVNEIIFGSKKQMFDIATQIVNDAQHTNASLESKAALMDTSFCILKGFAKIKKGATKSRSYVHERGILLDKGAKVDGLPDMSVDENDVKATHSSATSPIDPESVFYLMSKGIDEIGVKKLLVNGFFATSISKMHNLIAKELSMGLINEKLETKEYGSILKIDARNIWVAASDINDADMFKGHYKYRGAE